MLNLGEINELVDSWMCSVSCRDSAMAKMGSIDRNLRAKLVKVSIARRFSVRWDKEKVERYKCWLTEMGVI